MSVHQIFTSIADLVADQESLGGDETRLYRAIQLASAFLQKRIGEFIPVTETLELTGNGKNLMFIPPLLAVTSITNDDTALVNTDYILEPIRRFWRNGPYTQLRADPDAANLSTWCTEDGSVIIAGRWGLYELSALTGAVIGIGGQAIDATTLLVDDAGKVSIGDQLLIGSEQELITGKSSPTTTVTTISAAQAAADDTVTLTDGTKVKVGEVIRIGVEQELIKDINGSTGYVRRAWNGTVRAAHSINANVDVYRTFNVERGINGTTAAAHDAAIAISRYKVPEDITTLTREIATLGLNKAKSGYQGRTGNENLGTVFYNDIFPKFDLTTISDTYFIPRAR